MSNNKQFLVCDPGETGAVGLFNIDRDKPIDFIRDFEFDKYKKFFEKYKGSDCYLEYIATSFGKGVYSNFMLSRNIGQIQGLGYGLCNIIEDGMTPQSWKKPWNKTLNSYPSKMSNKEKDVKLCLELFPEFEELLRIEDTSDKSGTGYKTILHRGCKDREFVYHDGTADIILMAKSIKERGLLK